MTRLPRISVRAQLALLTLAFVLAGVAFAIGAPLFQAPDEPPHVDMVRHYAKHPFDLADKDLRIRAGVQQAVEQTGLNQGGPIDWEAESAPESRPPYRAFDDYPGADEPASMCRVGTWESCQNYHYGHPPTFYVLMALPDRLLHGLTFPTELLVLRLLSLLLAAPIVPLTYYAARQVWPGSTTTPLAATTLVALFAPLAAAAAAVNNDSLMLLFAGCLVASCARMLRVPSVGTAIAVGLSAGAGLLVKSNFQALTAAAGLIVLVSLTRMPRRDWVRTVVGFTVPAVAGGAFWLSNLVRFGTIGQPGGEILEPPATGPWNDEGLLPYALDHVDELVGRFWGLYGQTAVPTPSPWAGVLTTGAVALVVGAAIAWLVRHRRVPSAETARLWSLGLIPAVLAGGAVLASLQVYRKNGEVGRGLLGRYLYAGLPILAIGAVAAALVVVGRRLRPAIVFAVGTTGAAVFCLASFMRAVHGFYRSSDLSEWLGRAGRVSALADPGPALLVLLLAWLVAVTGSGYAVWSRSRPAYASDDAARYASAHPRPISP